MVNLSIPSGSASSRLVQESTNPDGPDVDQSTAICNLGDGNAFSPSGNAPAVPIMTAFGGGPLHQCRTEGSWDLDRAVSDHADRLIRSYREVRFKPISGDWEDLIFQFGPRAFLCADSRRIVAYASTHSEAERLVTQFTENFGKADPNGGSFHLISQTRFDIGTHEVSLPTNTILGEELLELHYPCGTLEWHREFCSRLQTRNHGLSIFEGVPGTGKTSYLRHLAGCLKKSHRFYFIPPYSLHVLKKPEFIGFWSDQRRLHSTQKFVVILEDSEAALMTRGSDNRDEVSAILNLSDGMLADFLRLQIICTINCTAADIDQALIRPGRLLSHRVFGKLEYSRSARLATSLGKQLGASRDYTLAEVFARDELQEITHARIGFSN